MSKRAKKRRKVGQKMAVPYGRYPGLLWRLSILGFLVALCLIILWLPAPPKDLSTSRPAFEEPLPIPSRREPEPLSEIPKTRKPLVAIIIDDMGYNFPLDEAFINLPASISFAFLPHAPFTKELARQAAHAGKDVMVHMPMEPNSVMIDPGPDAIYCSMDLRTIRRILNDAIESVPYASGLNNHMGSKLTADFSVMHIIMAELKQRGMFFVDSRTTKSSVAYEVAKSVGVSAVRRDVFLDHSFKERDILKEVNRLVKIASRKGYAVAIGHPHIATYRVLYNNLPLLKKKVKIVSIYRLIEEGSN